MNFFFLVITHFESTKNKQNRLLFHIKYVINDNSVFTRNKNRPEYNRLDTI